jgi:Ca2+-binding RTX toxin-like protein
MEDLESRQLMSVSISGASFPTGGFTLPPAVQVNLNDQGVLRITGTEADDKIVIGRKFKTGQLTVTANGIVHSFNEADVKRINANLGGGNDTFETRSFTTTPMNIKGNEGNDNLSGAEGDDRIDGGAGKDVLSGGSGSDVLIGGRGRDIIDSAEQTVVFIRDPGGDSPSFHDADELFADDGNKDVIRHDSADVLHTDGRDDLTDVFARRSAPTISLD